MSSVNITSETIFDSSKALSHQLKHLGLSDKKWIYIAKLFENNPFNFTAENGNIQTLDRKIVIKREDLLRKPVFGNGICAFFLKALQGKKYRQRMDNLAMGLLELMQKTQSSPLSQPTYKMKKMDVKETFTSEPVEFSCNFPSNFEMDFLPEGTEEKFLPPVVKSKKSKVLPKPVKYEKPQTIINEPIKPFCLEPLIIKSETKINEPIKTFCPESLIRENQESQEEKLKLSQLISQGTQLLAIHRPAILETEQLINRLQENVENMQRNQFLKCKNELETFSVNLEKLQRRINPNQDSNHQLQKENKDLQNWINAFKRTIEMHSLVKTQLTQICQKIAAKKADEENKKIQANQTIQEEKNLLTTLTSEGASLLSKFQNAIDTMWQLKEHLEKSQKDNGFDQNSFSLSQIEANRILRRRESLRGAVDRTNKIKNSEFSLVQLRSERTHLQTALSEFKESTKYLSATQEGLKLVAQKLEKAKIEIAENALQKERQNLTHALIEGNRLHTDQTQILQDLKGFYKKVEQKFPSSEQLKISKSIEHLTQMLQNLQRSLDDAKGYFPSEGAVIKARNSLAASIRAVREALDPIPKIIDAVLAAQETLTAEENAFKQEKQTLDSVLMEGSSLLSRELQNVTKLSENYTRMEQKIPVNKRANFLKDLGRANQALKDLQISINDAKKNLSSKDAVIKARKNLEHNINASTIALAGNGLTEVKVAIEEALKEGGKKIMATAQAKAQANVQQDPFEDDEDEDLFLYSNGVSYIPVNTIDNLLSLIDKDLKYKGDNEQKAKNKAMADVLKTIGLEKVKDFKKNEIKDSDSLKNYFSKNSKNLSLKIIQHHKNIINY